MGEGGGGRGGLRRKVHENLSSMEGESKSSRTGGRLRRL